MPRTFGGVAQGARRRRLFAHGGAGRRRGAVVARAVSLRRSGWVAARVLRRRGAPRPVRGSDRQARNGRRHSDDDRFLRRFARPPGCCTQEPGWPNGSRRLESSSSHTPATSSRSLLPSCARERDTAPRMPIESAYRLKELERRARREWTRMDVLLLPTTGTIYTIAAIEDNPIDLNFNLGLYTHFVNLMDLAAVAVPAGVRRNGLPFGVSLIGPAFSDRRSSHWRNASPTARRASSTEAPGCVLRRRRRRAFARAAPEPRADRTRRALRGLVSHRGRLSPVCPERTTCLEKPGLLRDPRIRRQWDRRGSVGHARKPVRRIRR